MTTYPDFVIRCTHGGRQASSHVATYKWLDKYGDWKPISVRGKRNVVVTTLRGDQVDDWWSITVADDIEADDLHGYPMHLLRPKGSPPVRESHEIACGTRTCRNRVAVPKDGLDEIFCVTAVAVRQAAKPNVTSRIWRDLAALASMDAERGTVTFTIDGLRDARARLRAVHQRP